MDSNGSSGWPRPGFFAALFLCLLASLTLSLGSTRHAHAVPQEFQASLQAYDSARHLLFTADTQGNIRVLNLFHNLAEIGQLRSPGRHAIHDMRLVPGGHSLWVLADNGIYRYDTHTLQQSAFQGLSTAASQQFGCVEEDSYVVQERPSRPLPGA